MELELQIGIEAALGFALVPLMQKIKKWFKIEESYAKAVSVVLVVAATSVFLNYVYGYELTVAAMFQTAGPIALTAILGNGYRKSRENNGIK